MASIGERIAAEADAARALIHQPHGNGAWISSGWLLVDAGWHEAAPGANGGIVIEDWDTDADVEAHVIAHDPASVIRRASALTQIVARHKLGAWGLCKYCSSPERGQDWPCPDVVSIAAAYGIEPDEIEP